MDCASTLLGAVLSGGVEIVERETHGPSHTLARPLGRLSRPPIMAAASSVEAAPLPGTLPPIPERVPEAASSAAIEADLNEVKTGWSQYWRRRRRRVYRRARRRYWRRRYY